MKKSMLKRAMALSCAFAVSMAAVPETTTANAQTTVENTVSTQETVHTMATAVTVKDETSLKKAIKNGATITLGDSFKIDACVTIPKGVSVTIKSDSSSNRVIGASKEMARLFNVEGTVTFKNITLKGGNGETNHLTTKTVIAVDGGTVNFNSSKVMLSKGILVRVGTNGKVTATDTKFVNSKGTFGENGGAIYIQPSGSFTMNGTESEISNNSHGGVHVFNGATFTMNAGEIKNNSGGAGNKNASSSQNIASVGMGGGVFNNGTFNFNSGKIQNNSAKECGNNVFNMNTMTVKAGVTLASIYLESPKITFNGVPYSPATTKLGFSAPVGTEIAKCASNVVASKCMTISGQKIANSPKDPSSIIVTDDYTITINLGEGQESISDTKPYLDTTTLPSQEAYTRIGYVLTGWQADTGEVAEPGSTVDVTGNKTYTAVWTPKDIAVEYYDEGGTKIADDTYNYESQGTYIIKEAVSKKGYEFKGWKDITDVSGNTVYNPGSTGISRTDRDDTLKLQAVYEEKTVQVNFNLNMTGATMPETTTALKYTAEVALSKYVPTATGYTFKGWYTDETCAGTALTVLSPATLGIEDTVQLYAKWEADDIPITYIDANVPNAQNSVKYDGILTITSYTPEKTGYTFKGWYLNDDKSKLYKAGDKISPKELGITGIKLTASYEKNATPSPAASDKTSSNSSDKKVSETKLEDQIPGDAPTSSSGTAIQLKITPSKKTLGVGDSFRFRIDTTEAYTVSTNSNIISVDNLGYVKARAVGKAVISVKATGITKTVTVTVKKAPTASTMKVKVKKVKKGKTVSVKPTFTKNTYCKSVKYSSSNKKIAKVTSNGKVKGMKKGTVKITIKCSTGAKKVVKIKVV